MPFFGVVATWRSGCLYVRVYTLGLLLCILACAVVFSNFLEFHFFSSFGVAVIMSDVKSYDNYIVNMDACNYYQENELFF